MLVVLRTRNFALLWCGQLISKIGDWVVLITLPYYVYQVTGSVLDTGLISIVSTVSVLLSGSLAGVFVDRWDRRWTMIASDILRALLLLSLLFVRSAGNIWIVYLGSFLLASISVFFDPARSALVPTLVSEDQLLAANALSAFSDSLPRFVGPVLGGTLLSLTGGLTSVALVDSASFLVSAVSIFLIVLPHTGEAVGLPSPAPISERKTFVSLWNAWTDGLRLISHNLPILGIFLFMGLTVLSDGLLRVVFVPFTKDMLHADAFYYSWLTTAQGVGGTLGGLLIAWLRKTVSPSHLLSAGLLLTGLFALLMFNLPYFPLALFCYICIGISVMFWAVSSETLLQQYTTDTYRGRVFGAFETTMSGMMLLSLTFASLFGDRVGILPLLEACALIYVADGLLSLLAGTYKKTATGNSGGA